MMGLRLLSPVAFRGRSELRPCGLLLPAVLLWAAAGLLNAQNPVPEEGTAAAPIKSPAQSATPAAPAKKAAAETPEEPPAPKWPVNDQPAKAEVDWDSRGLTVVANNASLSEVLTEIQTLTGTKVDGFTQDYEQRIFGSYGPGKARDVLIQLLQGTGLNVVMVGDLGQGAPRLVQLMVPSGGSQNGERAGTPTSADDDSDVDEPAQPQPPQNSPMQRPLRRGELLSQRGGNNPGQNPSQNDDGGNPGQPPPNPPQN